MPFTLRESIESSLIMVETRRFDIEDGRLRRGNLYWGEDGGDLGFLHLVVIRVGGRKRTHWWRGGVGIVLLREVFFRFAVRGNIQFLFRSLQR
jgi:hypothetical protein